jgi:hypothetical protein
MGRKRLPIDDALAGRLARGATIVDAARDLAVSTRTASRRIQDEAFREKVDERRRLLAEAEAVLAASTLASAITLRDLLESKSPGARALAARSILLLTMGPRRETEPPGDELRDVLARVFSKTP